MILLEHLLITINVTKNVTINLFDVEKEVLALIGSKKEIKRSDIAQELSRTEMTIYRAIKKLSELDLIKRVGSNKLVIGKLKNKFQFIRTRTNYC